MVKSDSLVLIKDSPWFWFMSLLFGAFLSGFAAYAGLMTLLGRTHVSSEELTKLKASADSIPLLQQQLVAANLEAQSRDRELKRSEGVRCDGPAAKITEVIPMTFRGSGTGETNLIAISAAPVARIARIVAHAVATAQINGYMKLEVTGAGQNCKSGRVYRNPTAGPELSAQVTCDEPIPPGESRQFIARAPNYDADGRSVDIEVTLRPQN
ncbi:hypothetical protein [Pseudoduganella sp. RAF53_2]|uniref:hypothetical protein n=1 Tax=unclassified Pseudoduganella TaxID=2637179 RepID=UPI003F9A2830